MSVPPASALATFSVELVSELELELGAVAVFVPEPNPNPRRVAASLTHALADAYAPDANVRGVVVDEAGALKCLYAKYPATTAAAPMRIVLVFILETSLCRRW